MASQVVRSEEAAYWVVWHYTLDEWQDFDAVERRNIRFLMGKQLAVGGGVSLFFGLLIGLFALSSHEDLYSLRPLLFVWLLVCLGMLLLVGGAAWREYQLGVVLRTARQTGPREVRIGPRWIHLAALQFPTEGIGEKLVRVTVRQEGMPALEFVWVVGKGTRSAWVKTLLLPVPSDHLAEAFQLSARFDREIIG